ncbi:hypothetical protein [Bacteroides sp.]
MKVSESSVAYQSTYLQSLKNRLITFIDETNDQDKLEQCLELLYADSMPGVYTDEEFTEVLKRSEASGNASEEEVKAVFAKWGI